ncbi:GDP-L-fucose synthase family protein [Candidatus Omnitrophota bacterium]
MDKKAKIYIAGHLGLVGSTISRALQEEGYANLIYRTSQELDLRKQGDTEKFFEQEKPEYVFLAAGKVGGILANNTYKAEFIYDNIMIAANIINAAYRSGVKKLLNLGSSCIYPKFAKQPIEEASLLTGSLEPTNESYAIAKIAAVKLCRYYNEQYGTNFISVMPNNLYGPHDNFNLETGHVMAMFIRKFYLAKLIQQEDFQAIRKDFSRNSLGLGPDVTIKEDNTQSIVVALEKLGIAKSGMTLWGSGKPFREFLYIDDLVQACILLMKKFSYTDIGEIINIGSGQEVTLQELADTISDIVGFSGTITWDTSRPDGTPRKRLNMSKINALGWKPKTTLREGIQKMYQWYMSTFGS